MTATLTAAEFAAMRPTGEEYESTSMVLPEEVASGEGYHPALRSSAAHILQHRRFVQLRGALESGLSDADVARLARAYFSASPVL